MTAAEMGVVLLRIADQEFAPSDGETLKRILARAVEVLGHDLIDRDEAVDAALRAGALARLDTDTLVQELVRRGVDS